MLINHVKKQAGFTLIELAVVLVIVGLLAGSFIGAFAERIDATRRDNTQKELEEVKNVLLAYAFSQAIPRLPCPDTDDPPDGEENCPAAAVVGVLPWKDLGIGYADAWDNRYRYWVNPDFSSAAGFQLATNNNNSATVRTRVGDDGKVLLDNAVAVVFSTGKNGLGGITVNDQLIVAPAAGSDEDDNLNANFMSRTHTEEGAAVAGGAFDDILVWINIYEIKSKMVEVGKLP